MDHVSSLMFLMQMSMQCYCVLHFNFGNIKYKYEKKKNIYTNS